MLLVTSSYHMPRAVAIAHVMLGAAWMNQVPAELAVDHQPTVIAYRVGGSRGFKDNSIIGSDRSTSTKSFMLQILVCMFHFSSTFIDGIS